MNLLETSRLILRPLEENDSLDIFEIISDEETCLDDGGFHAYTEMNDEFYALMKQFLKQRQLGIILKKENKLIGLINLQDEDRAVSAYELGFVLNKKYRHQGYAYEALDSCINTLFKSGEVEMVTVCHFPYNKSSEKLILKLGFTYEGIERKALKHARDGILDLKCYYKEK